MRGAGQGLIIRGICMHTMTPQCGPPEMSSAAVLEFQSAVPNGNPRSPALWILSFKTIILSLFFPPAGGQASIIRRRDEHSSAGGFRQRSASIAAHSAVPVLSPAPRLPASPSAVHLQRFD